MHLTPSDPDVATIYRKITTARLDLQPNFQRGEVWGKAKKQRLIDSILRGWHIPPVHIIKVPGSEKQEVLDGQQRLVAIRDFIGNKFPINGLQVPLNDSIKKLDSLYWSDLDTDVIAKIEDFTIRILTISDYEPGEPSELFHRLNQPTNLTSAEQRNAFFGEARQQVKDMSEQMSLFGLNHELIGFSNSRMAYDDVIAKFLLTIENETMNQKITANTITSRYRESTGFTQIHIESTYKVLSTLANCLSEDNKKKKLNKASFHSWMLFVYRFNKFFKSSNRIVEFIHNFESLKNMNSEDKYPDIPKGITTKGITQLVNIFVDRSSSRVADTSSVILRDIALWGVFCILNDDLILNDSLDELFKMIFHHTSYANISESELLNYSKKTSWGDL